MTYFSGEEVREGDEVMMRSGDEQRAGVVVKLILAGSAEAEDWSAPEGGVLIEGGGLGLSLTANLERDADVVLVRRGPRSA
jgi:hypothetical protein